MSKPGYSKCHFPFTHTKNCQSRLTPTVTALFKCQSRVSLSVTALLLILKSVNVALPQVYGLAAALGDAVYRYVLPQECMPGCGIQRDLHETRFVVGVHDSSQESVVS